MPAVGISMTYLGNLTPFCIVMLTAIVAAMSAFVFGYVVGILGGVTLTSPFPEESLPLVRWKKPATDVSNEYCQYGSFYLAALVWSLLASRITRRFGCKMSMLFGGVLFCAAAILNAGAVVKVWMVTSHIFHGIGFANQSLLLSITIAIAAANGLNYFFAKTEDGWGLSLRGAVGSMIERAHTNEAHSSIQSQQAKAAEIEELLKARADCLEAELVATKRILRELLENEKELHTYIDRQRQARFRKKKWCW